MSKSKSRTPGDWNIRMPKELSVRWSHALVEGSKRFAAWVEALEQEHPGLWELVQSMYDRPLAADFDARADALVPGLASWLHVFIDGHADETGGTPSMVIQWLMAGTDSPTNFELLRLGKRETALTEARSLLDELAPAPNPSSTP